jgi:cation:H+ antiporter
VLPPPLLRPRDRREGLRAATLWHFVLLIICAGAIYLSCEWFVNAVEWLGRRLNIGQLAVGTVLAAFGTALPESVVTLVAVTTGATAQARDIGVGAAMGGPLALATVAYAATGLALLVRRRRQRAPQGRLVARVPGGGAGEPEAARKPVAAGEFASTGEPRATGALTGPGQTARLARDQRWFLAVFVVKVTLGLVAFAVKPWLGLVFFAAYGVYFWREIRRDDDGTAEEGEPEPLKLRPRAAEPPAWAVLTQTLAALAVIFIASRVFVAQLDVIGPMLGLSTAVTALLLSPIATELPETMNAIIWVRQGKTRLALANISGAMMIQATVPSGLGLLFTAWRFDTALAWSGVLTMAAIGYLLATIRAGRLTPARLAWAGAFYLVFAAGLVPILS